MFLLYTALKGDAAVNVTPRPAEREASVVEEFKEAQVPVEDADPVTSLNFSYLYLQIIHQLKPPLSI
ncbi:hypothetical protein BG74_06745 [Sodalis-like endosymbiont of Proechinophthirus fluctus]|nr:hypothetical protein BG74_06745 [Sodalis-like endosymbiont of Proechinophthirus fluctus]